MPPSAIKAITATVVAAGVIIAAPAVYAGRLTIVDVEAPAINCVFARSCTVVVEDWVGAFGVPDAKGWGRLQSRTYAAQQSAPAVGTLAYEYRLDLTDVRQDYPKICVTKVELNFGPVVSLPYSPKGSFDVFVTTKGGIGSVALSSAEQVGRAITFTFSSPVCPGATSYFFGVAAKAANSVAGEAKVFFEGGTGNFQTHTFVRVP